MKLYAIILNWAALFIMLRAMGDFKTKKNSMFYAKKFVILNDEYYKIQQLISILSCLTIIVLSLFSDSINNIALYLALSLIIALLSFCLLKIISEKKNYIKSKS